MVSRRNYIIITIMMLVLLFMFQFSQVVKEWMNDYDTNEYADKPELKADSAWEMDSEQAEHADDVVFIGNPEGKISGVVEQWCRYTKRDLFSYDSLGAYTLKSAAKPEVILLDSSALNINGDTEKLTALNKEGVAMVFCSLPSPYVISDNAGLKELLGINSVANPETEIRGVHLYEGFFLGGAIMYEATTEEEQRRQDMDLSVPWYITLSGTKTYMAGMMDADQIDNEYHPALIWRNNTGYADVFAVNGTFMEDSTGIGILDGMMTEMHSYEIYPIINAQNVSITNFPGYADENQDEMMRIYSQSQVGVFRDIIWPGLLSVADINQLKLSCLAIPQYDYTDSVEPSGGDLVFYLKQLKEHHGEMGLSLENKTNVPVAIKLRQDYNLFQSLNSGYQYSAAYVTEEQLEQMETIEKASLFENLRTVTLPYDPDRPIVEYCTDNVTAQAVTHDGSGHTYLDNLRLRSIESALGYSNIQLDMKKIVWPESDTDRWEIYSEEFTSVVNTYWKNYHLFTKTTLSESDERVRNFLALDYQDHRTDDRILLNVFGTAGDSWFILRLHGEAITDIIGGSYQELEKDAYLICAQESAVQIEVEKTGDPHYELPSAK